MRARLWIAALCLVADPALAGEDFGLGHTASHDDIAGWNIDVAPDGTGLPPGRGTVAQGVQIFAEKCATCHGAHGEGKPMDALVGGGGTIGTPKPVKTVGSFWPYATTLFDFIRRAMPFNSPQALTSDEVYSVSAYLLWLNQIVPEDIVLDEQTLPKIIMPSRDRFVSAYPGHSRTP